MSNLPPPRYRIVERGRRLITVDALTGEEIGLGATLANVDLAGAKQTVAPPRNKGSSSLGAAPIATAREPNTHLATALSALPGEATQPPKALNSIMAPDKQAQQGKIIGLMIVGLVALGFLILSGLWVVPLALMIVPMTRKAILPMLADGLRKYLGQSTNG